MGKVRYCWVTLVPMLFLTCVTFLAGWMKIFSAKAAGFWPAILKHRDLLASPLSDHQRRMSEQAITNAWVDIAITTLFLVLVAAIIVGCAREWWLLLTGKKVAQLQESAYQSQPT
jgi:carbon starvation protein